MGTAAAVDWRQALASFVHAEGPALGLRGAIVASSLGIPLASSFQGGIDEGSVAMVSAALAALATRQADLLGLPGDHHLRIRLGTDHLVVVWNDRHLMMATQDGEVGGEELAQRMEQVLRDPISPVRTHG